MINENERLITPLPNTEKGFTIIDVIVGMLIASVFLVVSMQAMVFATYSRVKAQQSSEGLLLIQQDLEEVKFKAATLPANPAKCNPSDADNGYAKYLQDNLTAITNPKSVKVFQYNLTRIPSFESAFSATPYNVLKLNYTVTPVGASSSVATLYTEVIPDAAFQCN